MSSQPDQRTDDRDAPRDNHDHRGGNAAHPRKIPRDDLIADLQRVAEEVGRAPTKVEYDEHGDYAADTLRDRFGSWASAQEAAGLDVDPTVRQITDSMPDMSEGGVSRDDLLADLQRVADVVGDEPSVRDYREHGAHSIPTISERFGGFNAAKEELGFDDVRPKGGGCRVDERDLVTDIRRVADVVGGAPTVAEYDEHGDYSPDTARDRFGSWTDALREAGCDPDNRESRVSEADVVADIQRVGDEVGGAPTVREYNEHGKHAKDTVYQKFESWMAALREAGYDIDTRGRNYVSEDDLVTDIRRVAEVVGHPPTTTEYREHGAHAVSTARDRFGSWGAGVRAALPAYSITFDHDAARASRFRATAEINVITRGDDDVTIHAEFIEDTDNTLIEVEERRINGVVAATATREHGLPDDPIDAGVLAEYARRAAHLRRDTPARAADLADD